MIWRDKGTDVGHAPCSVYLDQNQWIYLAPARFSSERFPQHRPALKLALELFASGRAIFPLSCEHVMEVARIENGTRRQHLAKMMVDLSAGWFVVSPDRILASELKKAIGEEFGKPCSYERIQPLTKSLYEAFHESASSQMKEIHFSLNDFELLLATARATPASEARWGEFASEHEKARGRQKNETKTMRKRMYCVALTHAIQKQLQMGLHAMGLSWEALENLAGCGKTP